MKAIFIVTITLLSLFIAIAGLCHAEGLPLTLDDCYKLALKQSELIAINTEKIKEAEAHFLQAFGTVLPQVSFSHTQTWNNSDVYPGLDNIHESKFVFKQLLFSGFKEFAGIAGSHLEKSQRENEKYRAQQLLFVDVSDAFYLLIGIQEDYKTLQTVEAALLRRIKELKLRAAIGKSRVSEIISTQSQLYNIRATMETSKNQEIVARQLLEFLTGKSVDKVIDSEYEFSIKPESEYLAKAAMRADVLAANLAWKVSKEEVTIARSGYFPEVNLEGDYFTHRTIAPSDSKWGASLTVDVPIFEGTTTYGNVKEAKSLAKEKELLYKRLERSAMQDIRDAYANIQSDIQKKLTLRKALKSANLSYHLQIKDYRLNVVNNLDVLAAIQNMENTRRLYTQVLYEAKRFYWQLLAAAGEIEVKK